MANNLSDYAEVALLDWICGGATPTRPTTRYLALHTGAPGETGASNEVSTSGTNYSRQAITFAAASSGSAASSNTPTFTNTGTDFGTISHLSIWDASSGGNCLWQGAATASKAIANGDSYAVASGSLTVALD
jgi:hypothetical protein